MAYDKLLPDVKTDMIDLTSSTLDEEKSDMKNYKYVFKKKVFFDDTNKPPYVLKWARKTDNLKSAGVLTKLARYGYFAIDPNEHGILPEPFTHENIDENGHVVYIDGLLCGIEYEKYIEKRKREIHASTRSAESTKKEMESLVIDAGGVIDDEMREFIGS
jgi:hypothetical protein